MILHIAAPAAVGALASGPAIVALGVAKKSHALQGGGIATLGGGMVTFSAIGLTTGYWGTWAANNLTGTDYKVLGVVGGILAVVGIVRALT